MLKGRSVRKVENHGSVVWKVENYGSVAWVPLSSLLAEGETVVSELGYTTYKQHSTELDPGLPNFKPRLSEPL